MGPRWNNKNKINRKRLARDIAEIVIVRVDVDSATAITHEQRIDDFGTSIQKNRTTRENEGNLTYPMAQTNTQVPKHIGTNSI